MMGLNRQPGHDLDEEGMGAICDQKGTKMEVFRSF